MGTPLGLIHATEIVLQGQSDDAPDATCRRIAESHGGANATIAAGHRSGHRSGRRRGRVGAVYGDHDDRGRAGQRRRPDHDPDEIDDRRARRARATAGSRQRPPRPVPAQTRPSRAAARACDRRSPLPSRPSQSAPAPPGAQADTGRGRAPAPRARARPSRRPASPARRQGVFARAATAGQAPASPIKPSAGAPAASGQALGERDIDDDRQGKREQRHGRESGVALDHRRARPRRPSAPPSPSAARRGSARPPRGRRARAGSAPSRARGRPARRRSLPPRVRPWRASATVRAGLSAGFGVAVRRS